MVTRIGPYSGEIGSGDPCLMGLGPVVADAHIGDQRHGEIERRTGGHVDVPDPVEPASAQFGFGAGSCSGTGRPLKVASSTSISVSSLACG